METTYAHLEENLDGIFDRVTRDREIVIVKRKGAPPVAIIQARAVPGLMETEYLARSPRNKARLLSALRSLGSGKGKRASVEDLRREVGLEEKA